MFFLRKYVIFFRDKIYVFYWPFRYFFDLKNIIYWIKVSKKTTTHFLIYLNSLGLDNQKTKSLFWSFFIEINFNSISVSINIHKIHFSHVFSPIGKSRLDKEIKYFLFSYSFCTQLEFNVYIYNFIKRKFSSFIPFRI